MSFKEKNDVEIIQVDTIPVNLLLHTEKIPIYRKKMESEDILVMLSDGAFDGFRKWFGDGSTIFERNGCGTSTGDSRWIIWSKLQQTKNLKKR